MIPRIVAGDTVTFLNTIPDYPASEGWTLTHILRPRTGSGDPIEMVAVDDGDDYATTIPASDTGSYAPGTYTVVAQVSNDDNERFTLDAIAISGGRLRTNEITILANPAEGGAFDDRSHARKVLDALNAMIEGNATVSQKRYTIRDREVWGYDRDELIKWRQYYAGLVASEEAAARAAAGLPDPRRKYVRFGRP